MVSIRKAYAGGSGNSIMPLRPSSVATLEQQKTKGHQQLAKIKRHLISGNVQTLIFLGFLDLDILFFFFVFFSYLT